MERREVTELLRDRIQSHAERRSAVQRELNDKCDAMLNDLNSLEDGINEKLESTLCEATEKLQHLMYEIGSRLGLEEKNDATEKELIDLIKQALGELRVEKSFREALQWKVETL